MNLEREPHKAHHKKIDEQVQGIVSWIKSVKGDDNDTNQVTDFIYKYISYINDNTKRSFYENILDLSETRLVEQNKLNDLVILIEELYKLYAEFKRL